MPGITSVAPPAGLTSVRPAFASAATAMLPSGETAAPTTRPRPLATSEGGPPPIPTVSRRPCAESGTSSSRSAGSKPRPSTPSMPGRGVNCRSVDRAVEGGCTTTMRSVACSAISKRPSSSATRPSGVFGSATRASTSPVPLRWVIMPPAAPETHSVPSDWAATSSALVTCAITVSAEKPTCARQDASGSATAVAVGIAECVRGGPVVVVHAVASRPSTAAARTPLIRGSRPPRCVRAAARCETSRHHRWSRAR